MNKKLASLVVGISLLGSTGMTYSLHDRDKGIKCSTMNRQVYSDQFAGALNLWKAPMNLAVVDEHVHKLCSIINLPEGWLANGGIWNHHELLIRSLGLSNRQGSEVYVLFGSEDCYANTRMSQVTEDMIINSNEPWKKIISTRFPKHTITPADPSHRLSWINFPPKEAEKLYKLEPTLKNLRRGRLFLFYSLTHETEKMIKTVVCCDFDLIERLNKDGTSTTIMRNNHTKLCFAPDGQDVAEACAVGMNVAKQSDKVATDWYEAVTHDLVHRDECKEPEGKPYGINHLAQEVTDRANDKYTDRPNPLTGELLKIPAMSASCWVNNQGEYLQVTGAANPNDFAPLNKMVWYRIK